MKQQIVVIHGGDSFNTYEDYITYLKNAEITLEKLKLKDWKTKDWKAGLQHTLGEEFDVIMPRMPNSMNARFKEWKIWFEKIIPLLDDSVILIGHSLGGIFLAKYLSENDCPKKIKALFLIAAPFNKSEESLADFALDQPLNNLKNQIENIYLYHSQDDVVVPISHLEGYKKELPNAQTRIFENRGHFNMEHFPEIVEDLKKIAS